MAGMQYVGRGAIVSVPLLYCSLYPCFAIGYRSLSVELDTST